MILKPRCNLHGSKVCIHWNGRLMFLVLLEVKSRETEVFDVELNFVFIRHIRLSSVATSLCDFKNQTRSHHEKEHVEISDFC